MVNARANVVLSGFWLPNDCTYNPNPTGAKYGF